MERGKDDKNIFKKILAILLVIAILVVSIPLVDAGKISVMAEETNSVQGVEEVELNNGGESDVGVEASTEIEFQEPQKPTEESARVYVSGLKAFTDALNDYEADKGREDTEKKYPNGIIICCEQVVGLDETISVPAGNIWIELKGSAPIYRVSNLQLKNETFLKIEGVDDGYIEIAGNSNSEINFGWEIGANATLVLSEVRFDSKPFVIQPGANVEINGVNCSNPSTNSYVKYADLTYGLYHTEEKANGTELVIEDFSLTSYMEWYTEDTIGETTETVDVMEISSGFLYSNMDDSGDLQYKNITFAKNAIPQTYTDTSLEEPITYNISRIRLEEGDIPKNIM